MKRLAIIVTVAAIMGGTSGTLDAHASTKHNGACVAFSGSVAGNKYAGVKCYLDTAPGTYVIRASVRERDNKASYRNLVRLPKRLVRCTLTRGHNVPSGDWVGASYKISNC